MQVFLTENTGQCTEERAALAAGQVPQENIIRGEATLVSALDNEMSLLLMKEGTVMESTSKNTGDEPAPPVKRSQRAQGEVGFENGPCSRGEVSKTTSSGPSH